MPVTDSNSPLIFPVILAGGASSRLWPASGVDKPKWDLRLFAHPGQARGQSLLEGAWERARAVAPPERCFVVSGGAQAALVVQSLPDLPKSNLLVEPEPRDTSGAVAYAAGAILKLNGGLANNPLMFVLPGDHVIHPVEDFKSCTLAGAQAAAAHNTFVTFGIVPREASTAYGYVQRGEEISGGDSRASHEPRVYRVQKFKEKPDRATAQEYLDSGEFFWNGGIFLFPMNQLVAEIRENLPVHAAMIDALSKTKADTEWQTAAREFFPKLPKISIDFGIMEKAKAVATVIGHFEWDDIGSWSAVLKHLDRSSGNAKESDTRVLPIDANGNLVFAPGKRVALIGVENLALVQSGDDILICRLDRDQDVKKISEMAKNKS